MEETLCLTTDKVECFHVKTYEYGILVLSDASTSVGHLLGACQYLALEQIWNRLHTTQKILDSFVAKGHCTRQNDTSLKMLQGNMY